MNQDLDKSLVAHSEFIPFKQQLQMQQSLVAVSQKVYFQNASKINRQQMQKGKKQIVTIGEQAEQQSQNEFLEVGKWKKAKENTMNKDMATVKKQVDQIITQTRWQKKLEQEAQHEVIADESIVPDIDEIDKDEEIEDQTQQEEEEEDKADQEEDQQEDQDEEQQEESEEEEEEQEEEEESEQEEEDDEEEEENEEEEQKEKEEHRVEQKQLTNQESMLLDKTEKKVEQKVAASSIKPNTNSSNCTSSKTEISGKQTKPKKEDKTEHSQISLDDRTDTQSQMKKTEYLPAKWTKKTHSVVPNQSSGSTDPWKRKQAIIKRILLLVK